MDNKDLYLSALVDRSELHYQLLAALVATDHLTTVAAPTSSNAGLIAGRLQVIRELAAALAIDVQTPEPGPYIAAGRCLEAGGR